MSSSAVTAVTGPGAHGDDGARPPDRPVRQPAYQVVRQSFLVVKETGQAEVLLPALKRQEHQVREAFEQMFPDIVTRQTNVTNTQGWAAGRAAADLARLDANLNPLPAI